MMVLAFEISFFFCSGQDDPGGSNRGYYDHWIVKVEAPNRLAKESGLKNPS